MKRVLLALLLVGNVLFARGSYDVSAPVVKEQPKTEKKTKKKIATPSRGIFSFLNKEYFHQKRADE